MDMPRAYNQCMEKQSCPSSFIIKFKVGWAGQIVSTLLSGEEVVRLAGGLFGGTKRRG